MVDIHCHILPGVDDGPKTWELAYEMCRAALADGIGHIVATPHHNSKYVYDRSRLEPMLDSLAAEYRGQLEFSLGCDLHFCYDNVLEVLDSPGRFTIAGKRFLLVEFSDYAIPPGTSEQIALLVSRGIVPIVTHPERNPLFRARPQKAVEFVQAGAVLQLTASSLTGFWGSKVQACAEWLLEQGSVALIATDAHDVAHRPPVLSAARDILAARFGEKTALSLTESNPKAVVQGDAIPTP